MRKKKQTKSYSAEFKLNAVNRMAGAKTITGLAKELGMRRNFLCFFTSGATSSRRKARRGRSDAGAGPQEASQRHLSTHLAFPCRHMAVKPASRKSGTCWSATGFAGGQVYEMPTIRPSATRWVTGNPEVGQGAGVGSFGLSD
jgi:hypothetical protein